MIAVKDSHNTAITDFIFIINSCYNIFNVVDIPYIALSTFHETRTPSINTIN